ncbi:MAG: hypothetical protein WAU07_03780, partial [Microgenomates group bacterium]
MRITSLVIPQVSYYTTEVQESITFELSPQIASFQQGLESMIERLAELDDGADPDSTPRLTKPLLQMSLKQELALTSGRLLHKIFEILRDTPEINREQLESALIKLPDITIPELLPAIIDRIFQDELGLEKVKNIIGENVTLRNEFARYLIDALMISTQIPVNESTTLILKDLKISEMTVDVSPLAVILTIHNKKVFELLSKSTSIIGTFWGNLKIVFKGAKLEFPLITIKGVDSQTLAHEKSHVWHAIVKDTLKGEQSDQIERNNVGIRARWGNPISHSDAKRASEILQYKGFDFVSATHPETINLIVNYCLNEAKDELLATMNTPGRTVKAKYEMIIDPNDDTYDYL